ncbi:hypothetical protein PMIN01_12281 [Paraphaeosphaeria minitans]|uniref:Uncharacterized protein n=1 Tax=Paraphaeosphaeria minitans TaxID=565426 RepID=A0A9P6G5U6_9PLEO|nr:hypothetical protein PMIN01_12281 [Paraphaeosphaeria minitans]
MPDRKHGSPGDNSTINAHRERTASQGPAEAKGEEAPTAMSRRRRNGRYGPSPHVCPNNCKRYLKHTPLRPLLDHNDHINNRKKLASAATACLQRPDKVAQLRR